MINQDLLPKKLFECKLFCYLLIFKQLLMNRYAGPAEPQGHRDNVPVLFENLFSKSRKMSRCFWSV